ncbi:unnamed protein product [Cunninghamella echinulata]
MLKQWNDIPWTKLSYVLAKDIIEKNIHTTCLTPSEVQCFESAAKDLSEWIAFITSPSISPMEINTNGIIKNENDNSNNSNNNNHFVLSELETTSFRVRSLLYERFIPHVHHSNKPCCQHLNLDFSSLSLKARALPDADQTAVLKAKADLQQRRKEKLKQQQELQSRQNRQLHHENIKTEHSSQNMSNNSKEYEEANNNDKHQPNVLAMADPDKIPILDIYHTLETDQAVMIEQQKLKEYEAQEALNEEEEKENAEDHSLSMFNADGNFTLKYLLKGIAANRGSMALSDRELQNLLSDFKPHRSKWASDEKQGQEELYEAMEKVLIELKNYTAHSTPFLNKVSKREAPDYLDVIKTPMDLGTVAKKLKQLEYKTKQEFADDLYLIYENCLTYNTNPASEYRKHAMAMRRKTDRLLVRVPNLIIKDKSDGEQDDEGDDASEDDQDKKDQVSGKTSGKHKQPMTSVQKSEAVVDNDRASRERSLTRGSSVAPGTTIDSISGDNERGLTPDVYDTHRTYGGKQLKNQCNGILEQEEKDINGDLDADFGELREQVWREVTKKTRAELSKTLMVQNQEPFDERPALLRSPFEMERFSMMEHIHNNNELVRKLVRCPEKNLIQWTDRRRPADASIYDEDVDLDSSDDEILDAFFSRKISKPKHADEDDATKTDLFLPEYAITAGIPEIGDIPEEYRENNNNSSINNNNNSSSTQKSMIRKNSVDSHNDLSVISKGSTDVSLEEYTSTLFPNHGLIILIDKNIQRLKQIRRLHSKCISIRNNVPISTLSTSILSEITPNNGSSQPINTMHGSFPDSIPKSSFTMSTLPISISTPPPPSLPSSTFLSIPTSTPMQIKPRPPLLLTESVAQDILQRATSKLLTHAGFEGASESTITILNDVATDFILNIGKTLRSYWDDYGKQMSGEEILMHTLYENGISKLSDLDSYIHNDIERYGHRLDDVHRKLQTSYQDLLSGPTEQSDDDTEALLQDEDTFTTGLFGEDLGEDYFGFKELGLDQEYNPGNLNIPSRLWFGRNKSKLSSTSSSSNEPKFKYTPRPPFTPITSSKQTIGLLQPYFEKKLTEAENGRLIEDEFITGRHRHKSRHPPVNVSTNGPGGNGRKKSGRDGYGSGQSDKKGKRKRPLEEIKAEKAERAEKRRLKLEEKAQKLAEKEQKRKLREEMKEQERLAKQEAKEKKALARKSSKQLSTTSVSSPTVYDKEED